MIGANPVPGHSNHPSELLTKQDVKETISKSQTLLKVAAKYKVALWGLAGAMQDMSDAIVDLSRCKSVRGAESLKNSGLAPSGLQKCGELHSTTSKRLREFGDRLQRDLEEPLQKSIEQHAQMVTSNEKRLAYMGREIQDKIKKSEAETRKKRTRNPDQLQAALQNLSRFTAELNNLKYVNQSIILGEEARNMRAIQDQWAAVLRTHADVFGQSSKGAAQLANELNGILPSVSRRSSVDVTSPNHTHQKAATAKRPDTQKVHPDDQQNRRGSLDSNLGVSPRIVEVDAQFKSLERLNLPRPMRNASSPAFLAGTPQLSLPTFMPLSDDMPAKQASATPTGSPRAGSPISTPATQTPPRPIIRSIPSSSERSSTSDSDKENVREKRRVAFPTSKPIATVHSSVVDSAETPLSSTLSSLYPEIFVAENTHIASIPVVAQQAVARNPAVYVAGGDGDAESQMGSVVGATESLVGALPTVKDVDLVYAIHDFSARSTKEMSLTKGDVLEVRKRQGTWIYGIKLSRKPKDLSSGSNSPVPGYPAASGLPDRFRRGPPQQPGEAKPEVGWIPMAFVAKFSAK
ncbi:hypothetical protein BC832DRAFT_539012 [Gaertneriomyces semiglobifer]|nr:hypothetical protein BC832DRAFT_539012 [Gaertneriomyces semiglobifer]